MMPKVGVGVIILHEGKVLIGKRSAEHGNGSWAFPGGHLEFGESWERCAEREAREETGLRISNIRFASVTNDIFPEGKHYVTVYMLADYADGKPEVKEKDRCERWEWRFWEDLPEPLFLPVENLKQQGFNPFHR